ncbi:MAG: CsbD family protein, partial [Methylobacteriaceae bacterium]
MNGDQFRGASRHVKGRAQTALGGITGDPARQIRGAVNQVAGGAQYAYGRARERAEDLAEDGRHLADAARERADDLIADGRDFARHARKRGTTYGRQAVRYADDNRTSA